MNSNKLGKAGEQLFQQYMSCQGYKVNNVSRNPEYYYKGDFIITSPFTGQTKIFEVKTDNRIGGTGNLYLELTNVNSKNKGGLGWWQWCQADYLAYCDWQNRLFYVFSLGELKERVAQLPKEIKSCGYDSTGYIVALKDVADLYRTICV